MSTRFAGAGILVALLSAATFATSGPFAKSLLDTDWTPGAVVFLRIAGAAMVLAVPAVRALAGRWHLLRHGWRQVVAYGVAAIAVPQLAFFYAVQHLSVGVALLLEYLGLVLVVAWQCLVARRLPRSPTVVGIVFALVGLTLVLDLFGGVRIDGVGVAWGLFAALGLAFYYLLSGHEAEQPLPPLALAGGGMGVAALGFAVLGATGALPMTFHTESVELAGLALPWWVSVVELAVFAAVTPYIAGIVAARILGAKLASFVGLSEVMFAVLLAWVLLGELPRPVQLVGGLFILAGVIAVRSEGEPSPLAVEPGVAVGVALGGDGPVVTDDRVQLRGDDVVASQDDGRVVGAVQQHGPV
ncbi:MAG: EamA/RhaT family transporter [Marmoricola sp.]|nr:EamA/RhaT family transporter [Marmoricola sp.]